MAELLLAAHSGWRWVLLVVLGAATLEGALGIVARRDWLPRSATLARIAAITYDIQVLLGLVLYAALRSWSTSDRFYAHIHPAIMLIGLLVVHATSIRTRRGETSRHRHTWLATGSAIALIIVLAGLAMAP